MSARTLDYHWGKHLATYINNLNALLEGTPMLDGTLEEVVVKSDGAIFNNAAQAWNHIFFFYELSPTPLVAPYGALAEAIDRDFGSFEEFKTTFAKSAVSVFGSGWGWLSVKDGKLEVTQGANAANPLKTGAVPLLTVDVWEHSYYLDYQNRRADYMAALWSMIDWRVICSRYEDTLP